MPINSPLTSWVPAESPNPANTPVGSLFVEFELEDVDDEGDVSARATVMLELRAGIGKWAGGDNSVLSHGGCGSILTEWQ